MNKLLILVATILLVLVTTTSVKAIDSSSSANPAAKYGITFPVAELGNCNSLNACKTFCQDITNKDACIAFAKKKGFYKEKEAMANQQTLLTSAKSELGCDSADSCKQFCGEQQNWIKCGEFAKKHGLGVKLPQGSPQASPRPDLLEKAGQFLGCTSEDSCKAFCSQIENHQKCMDFARLIGLIQRSNDDSSGSGRPLPPISTRPDCQNLTQRFGTNSAALKDFYVKNCFPNPSVKPSSGFSPIPRPSIEPCTEGGQPCQSPQLAPRTDVRGISTERGLVPKILQWFGF